MIREEQIRPVNPLARRLIFGFLTGAFLAGVLYATELVRADQRLETGVALLLGIFLAGAILVQSYPVRALSLGLVRAWPLHLFTLYFFALSIGVHGGARLSHVAAYSLAAYSTYLLVPLLLVLNPGMLAAFVRLVALVSALLAIPSLLGAAGYRSWLGIPLRLKFSYQPFSGIPASGGFFEHPEGHAFQMGIGLFCCLYAMRTSSKTLYLPCALLVLAGLLVSQGRAAIFGVAIAILFRWLPEWLLRSKPLFLASLFIVAAVPFLVWQDLARVPGISGYLRLSRGSSGRDVAWQYAGSLVREKPWTGYGFLSSSELTEAQRKWLRSLGFGGVGSTFHNTFISKAVDLGLIAVALYALMYLVPLLRTCRPPPFPDEQKLVRSMILLTLTTAMFRDYNIGGIRSTAMTGAIFLGLTHVWFLLRPASRRAFPVVAPGGEGNPRAGAAPSGDDGLWARQPSPEGGLRETGAD